jgi:hypothetical protein
MSEWTNIGRRDTGNGAIKYWSESKDYPGVRMYEVNVYARGRGENSLWYEAIGDQERREFTTPAKAADRYEQLNRESAAERELCAIKANLIRRGIRL